MNCLLFFTGIFLQGAKKAQAASHHTPSRRQDKTSAGSRKYLAAQILATKAGESPE